MSEPFGQCMNDISSTLKAVYKAHSAVVVPGSGSVRLLPASFFWHSRSCLRYYDLDYDAPVASTCFGASCLAQSQHCWVHFLAV